MYMINKYDIIYSIYIAYILYSICIIYVYVLLMSEDIGACICTRVRIMTDDIMVVALMRSFDIIYILI